VNFTLHYYESELQLIARESSPLNIMLWELKEYLSVLSQGGSVALHRGEVLMSAQLSERVEKLFTHQPKMDGP
jgi:methylase of polypeptide subunit release factors